MRGKRLRQTLHMYMLLSSYKRTQYLKKQGIFAAIGENCSIMDRKIPLYANLIKIGNNVHIASKVDFITHDITHAMLNRYLKDSVEATQASCKIRPLSNGFSISCVGGYS